LKEIYWEPQATGLAIMEDAPFETRHNGEPKGQTIVTRALRDRVSLRYLTLKLRALCWALRRLRRHQLTQY